MFNLNLMLFSSDLKLNLTKSIKVTFTFCFTDKRKRSLRAFGRKIHRNNSRVSDMDRLR